MMLEHSGADAEKADAQSKTESSGAGSVFMERTGNSVAPDAAGRIRE
jgi:hypothetical protein